MLANCCFRATMHHSKMLCLHPSLSSSTSSSSSSPSSLYHQHHRYSSLFGREYRISIKPHSAAHLDSRHGCHGSTLLSSGLPSKLAGIKPRLQPCRLLHANKSNHFRNERRCQASCQSCSTGCGHLCSRRGCGCGCGRCSYCGRHHCCTTSQRKQSTASSRQSKR